MRIEVLLTALLLAGPAGAQDAARGAALFHDHCAVCHGAGGKGDGPMVPTLMIPPTNLTELRGADGVFPMRRVIMRIDGREALVAHGSPMPVFGPLFEGPKVVMLKSETGQPILVDQAVADLVAWIEAQQK